MKTNVISLGTRIDEMEVHPHTFDGSFIIEAHDAAGMLQVGHDPVELVSAKTTLLSIHGDPRDLIRMLEALILASNA
jgi:hypothetical protein